MNCIVLLHPVIHILLGKVFESIKSFSLKNKLWWLCYATKKWKTNFLLFDKIFILRLMVLYQERERPTYNPAVLS